MEFKDSELAVILKGLSMVSAVMSEPVNYLIRETEKCDIESIEGTEVILEQVEKCIEIERLVLRFAEKIKDPVHRHGILAETHRNIEVSKKWGETLKEFEPKDGRQKARAN